MACDKRYPVKMAPVVLASSRAPSHGCVCGVKCVSHVAATCKRAFEFFSFPRSRAVACPGCAAFDAVQATSWLNASCVLSSSAGGVPVYAVRSCNSTFVTSATCSDAQCTRCVTTATYPVNSCGTIIQAGVVQGVFFGCFQAASPPVMSNSTNNIFTDVTYTALDCTTNRLYQQISAVSGACVLGENRTCVCSGGTCTAARFATAPCNGTATAVTINQCLPRVRAKARVLRCTGGPSRGAVQVDQTTRLAFSGRTTCAAAARLTTPPADGCASCRRVSSLCADAAPAANLTRAPTRTILPIATRPPHRSSASAACRPATGSSRFVRLRALLLCDFDWRARA